MLSSKRHVSKRSHWRARAKSLGVRRPFRSGAGVHRICREFGHVWMTFGRERACCRCGTRRSLFGPTHFLTVVYEIASLSGTLDCLTLEAV